MPRLVSYGSPGQERGGLLDADGIADLEQAMQAHGLPSPTSDVRTFVERPQWRDDLQRLTSSPRATERIDPARVRLGPPVPTARKLMSASANTRSHLAEAKRLTGNDGPVQPMIVAKAVSAMCGRFDDIVLPPETSKLDYGIVLGIVIGRTARRVPPERVEQHLAGYTVVNDVAARDVQLAEYEKNAVYRVQFLGKSFDSFAPMGPCLVTTDEIPIGAPLRLRTWVDGALRQDSDCSDFVFGVADLVSYISGVMTLWPGDIVTTGSPAGLGLFMDPPTYLQPGQLVTCEVEGIGRLENRVRAESLAA